MAKRKTRSTRRRRRRYFPRIRRHLPKKISIINTATFAAAEIQALMPSIPIIQSGDFQNGLKSLAHEHLATWTGYESGLFGGNGRWNATRAMSTWVPIFIGALASRYLGKYVNNSLAAIPFIGKKLKL